MTVHNARARLDTAEGIYYAAAAALEEAKKANADDLISALEVKQAEYQMISSRAEYRIAKLELELLEEELKK
jgi:outer membrane protein TolC